MVDAGTEERNQVQKRAKRERKERVAAEAKAKKEKRRKSWRCWKWCWVWRREDRKKKTNLGKDSVGKNGHNSDCSSFLRFGLLMVRRRRRHLKVRKKDSTLNTGTERMFREVMEGSGGSHPRRGPSASQRNSQGKDPRSSTVSKMRPAERFCVDHAKEVHGQVPGLVWHAVRDWARDEEGRDGEVERRSDAGIDICGWRNEDHWGSRGSKDCKHTSGGNRRWFGSCWWWR